MNICLSYVRTELGGAERRPRRRRRVKGRSSSGRGAGQGETPDWIRELFALARRGNLDKLVSKSKDHRLRINT